MDFAGKEAPSSRALSAVVTAALAYLNQGYAPLPLEPRRKKPRGAAWQKTALAAADVPSAFGPSDNLGLLLGDPGGCLVDVDLDCPEALALAPHLLPQTPSVFGRASSPRAHWLYLAPKTKTAQYKDSSVSPPLMLVELRSTGAQTMVPPSLHPDGERVRWEPGAERAVPSMEDGAELAEAVRKLAVACLLVRHGVPQSEAIACAQGGPLPRAALDGSPRAALALEWLGLAPPPPAKASPAAPPRPAASSIPNDDDELERAASAYNSAHPLVDLPKSDGDCPICQHKECFGTLAGSNGARWACFSASHPLRAGVRGKGCYHGDAVDLAAHAAGLVGADARAELLRAEGYLAPRAPRTPSLARGAGASSAPPTELAPPAVASPPSSATKPPSTKPAAPRRAKAAPPAPLVPPEANERPERPTIQLIPGQLHVVNEQGAHALAADPALYRRDTRPVAVFGLTPEDQEAERRRSCVTLPLGAPVVAEVSAPLLCDRLSAVANWERLDTRRGIFQPCDVPERNARAIHARLDWPQLRPLVGVTQVPVLRPDGSLFSSPGYDRQTGLFYWPAGPVAPIPEKPTRADALKACEQLLEVVCDFPFDHPAGPAAWLAGLLSAVGFGAYGHTSGAPMFAFSASVAASGKTTLADAIANLLTGADMPRIAYAEEDAEMRKSIFGLCRSGNSLALIDNVPNGSAVGWPSLDAALTGRTLEGRILGTSETQRVDHRIVWYLTGNNFSLASDTPRRTILARLEPKTATPEEREGFRHPDLLGWVRAERPRLLASALTLLRGYVVAGRPSQKLRPIGSFKAWSDTIRAPIVWAGLPDPCELLASRSPDADPTAAAHARLLLAWEAADTTREGLAVGEILRRLPDLPELSEALSELLPTRDGSPPPPNRLGYMLRAIKGRRRDVGDGLELAFHQETMRTRAGTMRWTVKREAGGNAKAVRQPAGDAGDAGDHFLPTRASCQFEHKASANNGSDNSTGLVAKHPLHPLHPPASTRSVPPSAPPLAGPAEAPSLPPNAALAPPLSGPVAQGADEGEEEWRT